MAGRKPERSAGFIVFRERAGRREYLVVRDRKHGNWGFPKGHLEPGESELEAARREAREEAGLRGLRRLPGFRKVLSYPLSSGATKRVTYFLARLPAGAEVRRGKKEITAFRWAKPGAARRRLTFPAVRRLLAEAELFLGQVKSER